MNALVVNFLSYHEMIDSLAVFMFPWRGLPAVTWKKTITLKASLGRRRECL